MSKLVSVGIPVYNGEKFIEKALNSIIRQDYKNIEIIISDNASTDRTRQICESFKSKDKRITYYREENNKGAAFNFQKVFRLSSGEYFMWVAHDDLFESTYITKCIAKLEEYPTANQCVSDVILIDELGKINENITYNMPDTLGMQLEEKIEELFSRMWWLQFYGLYRSKAIKDCEDFDFSCYGFDVLFTLNIILRGDIVKVKEPLFYYRLPSTTKDSKEMADTINPSKSSKINEAPYTNLSKNIIKILQSSKIVNHNKKRELIEVFLNISLNSYNDWVNNILLEHNANIYTPIIKNWRRFLAREIVASGIEPLNLEKYSVNKDNISKLTNNRSIYIWGAGNLGIMVYKYFISKGISVEGFIDRDPIKAGMRIFELFIELPEAIIVKKVRPYIFIASMYAKEISDYLIDHNYKENIDYIEI